MNNNRNKFMQSKNLAIIIPDERIEHKIFLIRGKKVMIDRDLSELYGVETRMLNQSVRRNIKRFPPDFMFQLDEKEMENLMSQIVISSWGGVRKLPLAFTEQGVAMLSSVLNSERAIRVNIQIIRTFTKMREMIISNKILRLRVEELEKKYDKKFKIVFDTLRQLLDDGKDEAVGKIGFKAGK